MTVKDLQNSCFVWRFNSRGQ